MPKGEIQTKLPTWKLYFQSTAPKKQVRFLTIINHQQQVCWAERRLRSADVMFLMIKSHQSPSDGSILILAAHLANLVIFVAPSFAKGCSQNGANEPPFFNFSQVELSFSSFPFGLFRGSWTCEVRSNRRIISQCRVCGNMSTATARTGTKGS